MARVSDLLAANLPALPFRTKGQTLFHQLYSTPGGPVGQKAGFMQATEAAVYQYLGLTAKASLDPNTANIGKKGFTTVGSVDWAAVLAFLEQLWTTLAPIIIPLL